MTNDFPIERVFLAAEEIAGNCDRAATWPREPLVTFDGKTVFYVDAGGILEQKDRELQRAAESWNSFGQDHGSFADEFSTL